MSQTNVNISKSNHFGSKNDVNIQNLEKITFLFAPNFYLAILANLISVKKYGKIVTIFIYKHLFWVFTFMAYFEKFMISTSEHKCLWTQRASNKKLLCLFFYGAIYLHREARAQLGKFERGARRFICNRNKIIHVTTGPSVKCVASLLSQSNKCRRGRAPPAPPPPCCASAAERNQIAF